VPPMCTIAPSQLTLSSGKNAITVTLGAASAASFAFNIQAAGTDVAKITSSVGVTLNVYDFQIPASIGSQTVTAGKSTSYPVSFTVLGGTKFPDDVSLSCGGLPSQSTCSFSPATLAAGSANTQFTLNVVTTAPSAEKHDSGALTLAGLQAISWPGLLGLLWLDKRQNRRGRAAVCIVFLSIVLLALTSCGGGGATISTTGVGTNPPLNGTKPGTYNVIVTATSGPLSHSGTAVLIVQ